MDNKKNNQKLSQQISPRDIDSNSIDILVFGENYVCAYLYKKTEKLLMALHLVTNIVPENEPARSAIRDKSISILSDILYLRSGFRCAGSYKRDQVVASLHEITSLLLILNVTGFVSDMNLGILKTELVGLIVFLQDVENTESSEKIIFNSDHFKTEIFDKGHNKRSDIKDEIKKIHDKRQKTTHSFGVSSPRKIMSSSHKERRSIILDLIKKKESVSIKDISSVITECSEKTIQRELVSLINENVLKKEGSRRWSTYSLNLIK